MKPQITLIIPNEATTMATLRDPEVRPKKVTSFGTRIKFLCFLGVSAVIIGCGVTDKPEVGSPKPEESTIHNLQSKISDLVTQLGADDWPTREKAQAELTKLGEELIEQYRKLKRTQMHADVIARSETTKQSQQPNEIASLPLAMTLRPIKAFAEALQKATKDNDAEIRMRAKNIRQHLYSLTLPKIAFVSNRDGNDEIYVMDADGKNQSRLTKNEASDGNPAWSPDGTKIIFSSVRNDQWGIYIMDPDGGNQTRLIEKYVYHPAWSPNGTKIAFVSEWHVNKEIYVMDADGKNPKRLTENPGCDTEPTWSPDGTKIAFVSERDGNAVIYVMDADGKNQQRLTQSQKYEVESPAWNPDGSKIAFALDHREACNGGISDICVIDADGKNQQILVQEQKNNNSPTWNSDGTKIAFVSNRDGNWEIYVMDADGTNQKNLTQNQAEDERPAWGPWFLKEISELFSGEKVNK